jgi:hypothetical protein
LVSDIPASVDPRRTTSYRLLLAAVIVLGVLIVIALGMLVVGLVTRVGARPPATTSDDATAGVARLALPPGGRIVSMDILPERLILRVHTDAGDEVDIIDTGNGRLLGQVKESLPR